MNRRRSGFTLIEVLIAVAVVGFVLAAAATFFILSVRQYTVQSKIVETNVEGVLGLELLRKDLESLGFGLPWNNLGSYTERTSPAGLTALNDSSGVAPRAVIAIDNVSTTLSVNQSDYLAIKSASVGKTGSAGKWTTLTQAGDKRPWTPSEENIAGTDYVIVLALGSTDSNRRSLVNPGSYAQFGSDLRALGFAPVEPYSANIVYGIDNESPARPFNRADYFIADVNTNANATITVPQRCAPNTGVLVKAVVAHNGSGTIPTLLPLLDCVADMQVVFRLDNTWMPPDAVNGLGLSAANLRARLMELRVSILTHEGGLDNSYTFRDTSGSASIYVGMADAGQGRPFPITPDIEHYRWKVYNLVIKPWNLAQ